MFHSSRNKWIILTVVMLTALCLVLSCFLPTIHSQITFALPCTINTTGNAWEGYIAFDLELGSNFMGTGGNSNYFVVMDTNGTVLALRQSDSSYGAAWNIAPETLMFLGEPQVDGANSAPTYETHFWNLTTGTTEDFPNVLENMISNMTQSTTHFSLSDSTFNRLETTCTLSTRLYN